eukprot:7383503-Prymnesium_polylepis.1
MGALPSSGGRGRQRLSPLDTPLNASMCSCAARRRLLEHARVLRPCASARAHTSRPGRPRFVGPAV